eukprot:CAMPEP_0119108704 /NCGR_PEP_ID=MMETSP1180-20130426/15613_1 /TAXON_ID=3052 ORGANISM="Chlamydomonas cf sp, Strain CCMP681" /NCGR_SAMPLE_ID=MMETSP1180 /ASSEMBLY_ACC=CAM_ASM_000741 /LENGTH=478 /DNA_ID=CAMNT_0007094355 /DNA_START=102 /DNA_END=1538 /DNA_ORIENTATION=-
MRRSMRVSSTGEHSQRPQGSNPRAAALRLLLKQQGILQAPCCHDALSARLIERAGFKVAFMSGFATSGSRLGAPDAGLISYAEMVDVGRSAVEATKSLPIIGDGDTGYGNAMNVKRTVRGYAQAGLAGILIEDQVAPKSCGHVKGKRVVGRHEAVARIRAAVDAREEGADILIVARTDARQAVSLEEALWRVEAFAEAGADIIFIDALESEEEMRQFCWLRGSAARVPKMASLLEGGGKTPMMSPSELQSIGFKMVAYPLSLLGVSIRAMELALTGLKTGKVPEPSQLGSFAEIQEAVGFPEYYAEEARYAVPQEQPMSTSTQVSDPPVPKSSKGENRPSTAAADSASASSSSGPARRTPEVFISPSQPKVQQPVVVEPDEVREQPTSLVSKASQPKAEDINRPKFFLVRITETATGVVKLETRIPSNFMAGVAALVPGVNLESVVERALRERTQASDSGALVEIPAGSGDLLQVFLE